MTKSDVFIIPVSLIVAFMLTILPMPGWAIWLRPLWVLMALIYWAMVRPELVGVGVAWLSGLFLDVLQGTLLGEHAFALTIVIFVVAKMSSRMRMFHVIQQSVSVFFLSMFFLAIIFGIQGFLGLPPESFLYWAQALTTMLLWPWFYSILRSRTRDRIA